MGAAVSAITNVVFDIQDLRRVIRLERHYAPWDDLTEQTHLQLVSQPRLVKAFDWYGGKFERYPEPADLPHTCAGCCCSIFFIFILIFLAANTGVQAMAREEEMNFGPLITLHMDCVHEVLKSEVRKAGRMIPMINNGDSTVSRSAVEQPSWNKCVYKAEMDALANPLIDPLLRWTGMKNYNPSWDIPVLNLTVNYDVEMFSTTATLGAIEVFDEEAQARGHDQDSFESTIYPPGGWEEVPVARAASERVTIPIDTVADVIQPIPLASVGPHATSFPIRTIRDQQEIFRNSYESGRWSNPFAESAPMFSNHTAYGFFRFDDSQLEQLKSCQLEVGIINKDLFDLLNQEAPDARTGGARRSDFLFTNTSTATWDPELFVGPGGVRSAPVESSLIRLESSIYEYDLVGELRGFLSNSNYNGINVKERARRACDDPAGYWCRDAMGTENWKEEALASVLDGWGIFVNYVHNANVTVTEMSCDGKTMGAERFAERFDVAHVRILRDRVNSTATTLSVKPGFTRAMTRPPPYVVLLAGPQGMEKVTVENYDQRFSEFRVKRHKPIDFTAFVDAPIPATPPAAWACATVAYNDGKTCDCRCGAPDPDCTNPERPARNCAPDEVCGPLGTCTVPQALLQTDGDTILMSEGCSSLVFRRDKVSLFAGEATCAECPGSPQSFMSSAPDRDLVCRAVPRGFVDSREVPNLNAEDGDDPATSRKVKIRTHPDGAPFPTSARRLQAGAAAAAAPSLVISAGPGNSEEVMLSGGSDGVFQLTPSSGTFAQPHFGRGQVMSSPSGAADAVVKMEPGQGSEFPAEGPFSAILGGDELSILESSGGDMQRLVLAGPAPTKATSVPKIRGVLKRSISAYAKVDKNLYPFQKMASYYYYAATVAANPNISVGTRKGPHINFTFGALDAIASVQVYPSLIDATNFVDADAGSGSAIGCYPEFTTPSSSTLCVETMLGIFDGENCTSLFSSTRMVPVNTFCDGVHDGHLLVSKAGFSEAYAASGALGLEVLIRGDDKDSVADMEVRQLTGAWDYRVPVAEAGETICDAADNCVTVPKLSMKPELFRCPGLGDDESNGRWGDGICDCGCGRQDIDCSANSSNPVEYAEWMATLNKPFAARNVRNYCKDTAARLPVQVATESYLLPGTIWPMRNMTKTDGGIVSHLEVGNTDLDAEPREQFRDATREVINTLRRNVPAAVDGVGLAPGYTVLSAKVPPSIIGGMWYVSMEYAQLDVEDASDAVSNVTNATEEESSFEPDYIVLSLEERTILRFRGGDCNVQDTRLKTATDYLDCAQACVDEGDCRFFIYADTGYKAGRCYKKETSSYTCPEGFSEDLNYNFYEIVMPAQPATPILQYYVVNGTGHCRSSHTQLPIAVLVYGTLYANDDRPATRPADRPYAVTSASKCAALCQAYNDDPEIDGTCQHFSWDWNAQECLAENTPNATCVEGVMPAENFTFNSIYVVVPTPSPTSAPTPAPTPQRTDLCPAIPPACGDATAVHVVHAGRYITFDLFGAIGSAAVSTDPNATALVEDRVVTDSTVADIAATGAMVNVTVPAGVTYPLEFVDMNDWPADDKPLAKPYVPLQFSPDEEVYFVFAPTKAPLLVKRLRVWPSCGAAIVDPGTFRFCGTGKLGPSSNKSTVTATTVPWYDQLGALEVLALDAPLRKPRERGSVIEMASYGAAAARQLSQGQASSLRLEPSASQRRLQNGPPQCPPDCPPGDDYLFKGTAPPPPTPPPPEDELPVEELYRQAYLANLDEYIPGGKRNICDPPRVFMGKLDVGSSACADACPAGFLPDIDRYCVEDELAFADPEVPARTSILFSELPAREDWMTDDDYHFFLSTLLSRLLAQETIMNISAELIELESYTTNEDLSLSVDFLITAANVTGVVSPTGAVRRLDAARLMLPLAGLRNVASDPQSANLMKVIMPLYGGNPSLLRPFGRDGKPPSATDQMVQAFADNPRPRLLQASGGQAPPEIYMQPALRFSDSDLDAEYSPRDRAKPTFDEPFASPDSLELEYALFVVPEASPLDAALCPTSRVVGGETAPAPDNQQYILAKDRRLDVPAAKCKYKELCTPCAEDEEDCDVDCPGPSSTLQFQVNQPMGAKYLRQQQVTTSTRYRETEAPAGVGTAFGQQKLQLGGPTSAESVRADFAFSFGPEAVAAEETVLASGDETVGVETGLYRGVGVDGKPAALPRVRAAATLVLDKYHTKQIVRRAIPKGWHRGMSLDQVLDCADKGTRASAESSLSGGGCMGEAAFPLTIPLPDVEMQPGFITTAYVTVGIVPVYYASAIGRLLRLESWSASVLRVRVETEEHDYSERTKGSFRVRVEVELNARRMYVASSFDVYDFCFNLGSWQGLWLFGATLLGAWVTWIKPWGRLGPNDPLRARDAVSSRVENARLEKRTMYLQGRYEKEQLGDETFEMYCARLQRGEMVAVDVLQEKYDEDAGEGDALALEDGEDPRADDAQKMMQKTMVEMDKWGEKKLPAVHVG